MKILCIFYGIGRGLDISEPSIRSSIISPLRRLGHDLDLAYLHQPLEYIDNPRSGENGAISPVSEGVFDGATKHCFPFEDVFDGALFAHSKSFKDSHGDKYTSNKNIICQLNLISKSVHLYNFSDYDRILLCRDDLLFEKSNLQWSKMISASASAAVISMWCWNKGLSERFLLASPRIASLFATRIGCAKAAIEEYGTLNAERLQYFVAKKNAIKVASLDLKFFRCRINSRIHKEKFRIPYWRPFETMRIMISVIRYRART